MRPLTFAAFAGFVTLIAGTYCPLLHLFPFRSWDVYDLNKPYGIVMLLVFVIGIIGTVFDQHKITRLAAILSLFLVSVFFIAALMKVETSFSFIPFKAIEQFLTRQIKFKWGWYVLAIGQVFALSGIFNTKRKIFNQL
jgi:hypothetical protein